jgi:hypothetical protein
MSIAGFDIQSTGVINDVAYTARGEGLADADLGRVDFAATFEPVPAGANAFGSLLSILIIPTVAFGREFEGSTNLLSLAGDSFDFVQEVAGDEVSVRAEGSFGRVAEGENYLWNSRASGSVTVSDIVSVNPFAAVMLSAGPGRLIETITIPLTTSDGAREVTIVRHFAFAGDRELPGLQIRDMLLEPEVRGATAAVRIQADIYPFARVRRCNRANAVLPELQPLRRSSQ